MKNRERPSGDIAASDTLPTLWNTMQESLFEQSKLLALLVSFVGLSRTTFRDSLDLV
jgi:hypothetical protein